ncbi:helix-turn-helix domain-containing protein [Sphingobacterium multivorum]|uniref:helix-turn-helix domain-containing protein n=1 Tax=Sphingobacterium TaxID=28453 RepID=UPI00257AEB32|nr:MULTISPECIES: helix-turn-helix transcriptional regulator [Sphingobacterium]
MELTIEILRPNIIEVRDATGLNQEYFSLLCEFSRATLTNIENGKSLPSVTTLNKISQFTTVGIDKLARKNYIPPLDLREKLQKKYANDLSKSVLLEDMPSVPYILKYRLLRTNFLNEFRVRKEILKYIEKNYGWSINPNTLTTNLRRMGDLLVFKPNPDHDNGYVYRKK